MTKITKIYNLHLVVLLLLSLQRPLLSFKDHINTKNKYIFYRNLSCAHSHFSRASFGTDKNN